MKKLSKFLFKTFGETNILIWIWGLTAVSYLTVVILLAWAAIHFITKYW